MSGKVSGKVGGKVSGTEGGMVGGRILVARDLVDPVEPYHESFTTIFKVLLLELFLLGFLLFFFNWW